MKQQGQSNLFSGGLNKDDDEFIIPEEDFIHAVNIRNTTNRKGLFRLSTNIEGNTLIPYQQPSGDNVVVGSYENLSKSFCIYFVWNSQGNHEIRQYDGNQIVKLSDVPELERKYIPFIDLVDNKLLYWTDSKPRKINIEKSFLDKQVKGNVYFASQNTPFAPAGSSILAAVFDGNNNVIAVAATAVFINADKQTLASIVGLFLNANPVFANLLKAEVCNESVEVTFIPNGYYTLEVRINNDISTIFVPSNYYHEVTDTIYDAGKYPLACPPSLAIKQDADRKGFDRITGTAWQFRTELIYDDNEKSVLSPISDIAFTSCEQTGNYIEIDYTDERLNNQTDLSIIKAVRIYGRDGNNNDFRLIAEIPQAGLWDYSGQIGRNTFRFYNDGIYTVLDDFTQQKPFDDMPIKPIDDKYSICQEYVDGRIMYARYTKNYDKPCINADLLPTFSENDDLQFTVIGQVQIINTTQFKTGNPKAVTFKKFSLLPDAEFGEVGKIGVIHQTENDEHPVFGGAGDLGVLTDITEKSKQILPEAGFPIYFLGTNHLAISKQEANLTGITYNTNNVIDTSTQVRRDELEKWYDDFFIDNTGRGLPISTWRMNGVRPGVYVVRVASHLCSYNDKLGMGSRYDLYNNNLYQTTSTYLRGINVWNPNINDHFPFEDSTEVILEIKKDSTYSVYRNNQLLLSNQPIVNGELFLGQMWIEDLTLTYDNKLSSGISVSGYLLDNNARAGIDAIRTAISMERQRITFSLNISKTAVLITQSRKTDHNGFFYTSVASYIYTDTTPYRIFIKSTGVTVGTSQPLVIRDIENYYLSQTSIYKDIDTGQPLFDIILWRVNNKSDGDKPHFFIVAPNTNTDVSENARTIIRGRVVDANNNGVSGLPVLYTRTGRVERTQTDGTYSIIVYGAYDEGNSRTDFLLVNIAKDCVYNFPLTNNPYWLSSINIDPFGVSGFNMLQAFIVANINAVFVISIIGRKLKSGGKYSWAIIHVDKLNRRHSLVPIGNTYIPFTTEQRQKFYPNTGVGQSDGTFTFDIRINTLPPDWADKAYVLRTLDENYQTSLQMPLFDVKWVSYYDTGTDTAVETTFGTFSAKELYLGFKRSITAYSEQNSGNIKGWTFEKGDRVRFIRRNSGVLYDELYDVPILFERIIDDQTYYIIDVLDALGEVQEGDLVEVYRPRRRLDDEQKLYFEIHTCIDIENGQYVNTTTTINTGDTYTRIREVPIQTGTTNYMIEDASLSDNIDLVVQDIGRIGIEDIFVEEIKFVNQIAFSGKYIPNTIVNNLNRFDALNVAEMPRSYGDIFSIILTDDNKDTPVLLSIHENKVLSIYVGAVQYRDTTGSDLVSLSNEVLGSFRTLQGTYGTINAESVYKKNGYVYFYDGNRRKFIKYTNNGLQIDSDKKMKAHFDDLRTDFMIIGYDDFHDQTIITYEGEKGLETLAWNEVANKWESFYSFTPEYYGSANEDFLSFLNGELWLHNSNPIRNNFYGVQHESSITSISKVGVKAIKTYLTARQIANVKWFMQVETPANSMYPIGMDTDWDYVSAKLYEGDWWSDILRDRNDPQYFGNPTLALFKARNMKGHYAKITLTNRDETLAWIRGVDLFYIISEQTSE